MSVEPVPRFKHSFSLDPKFVYHVAPTSRTALIERHGLKINMPGKWRRNMECDRWSDVFYGVQPLYVVTDPSRIPTYLEGDLFEIRADGLELACDLPSLLEYGPRVKDRYGRFLAYVFVAGTDRGDGTGSEAGDEKAEPVFVNLELVKRGLARAYVGGGHGARYDDSLAAELEASTARRGIWSR